MTSSSRCASPGVDVEIEPGRGPVFANPVRTASDVDRITAIDPDGLDGTAIAEAVRLVTAELGDTPLIGFAGAPLHSRGPTSSRAAPPRSTCVHGR